MFVLQFYSIYVYVSSAGSTKWWHIQGVDHELPKNPLPQTKVSREEKSGNAGDCAKEKLGSANIAEVIETLWLSLFGTQGTSHEKSK